MEEPKAPLLLGAHPNLHKSSKYPLIVCKATISLTRWEQSLGMEHVDASPLGMEAFMLQAPEGLLLKPSLQRGLGPSLQRPISLAPRAGSSSKSELSVLVLAVVLLTRGSPMEDPVRKGKVLYHHGRGMLPDWNRSS